MLVETKQGKVVLRQKPCVYDMFLNIMPDWVDISDNNHNRHSLGQIVNIKIINLTAFII